MIFKNIKQCTIKNNSHVKSSKEITSGEDNKCLFFLDDLQKIVKFLIYWEWKPILVKHLIQSKIFIVKEDDQNYLWFSSIYWLGKYNRPNKAESLFCSHVPIVVDIVKDIAQLFYYMRKLPNAVNDTNCRIRWNRGPDIILCSLEPLVAHFLLVRLFLRNKETMCIS